PHRSPCHPAYSSSYLCFNETSPTDIYTLSLHDALPIFQCGEWLIEQQQFRLCRKRPDQGGPLLFPSRNFMRIFIKQMAYFQFFRDRKSTRLNSSHVSISYAVFCLKKKKLTEDTREYSYK